MTGEGRCSLSKDTLTHWPSLSPDLLPELYEQGQEWKMPPHPLESPTSWLPLLPILLV